MAYVGRGSMELISAANYVVRDLIPCGTYRFIAVDANDVDISGHLEASTAYVGGRTNTLFSGIYVRDDLPGLVTVLALGGLK